MKRSQNRPIVFCIFMMAFMVLPTIGFAQQNVLVGTWYVRCPKGHDDKVDCLTGNHMCEKCFSVAVTDGKAKVVCPKGHPNSVSGLTQSKKCSVCGKECRRDTSFKVYDPNKDFAKLQDELKKKGC